MILKDKISGKVITTDKNNPIRINENATSNQEKILAETGGNVKIVRQSIIDKVNQIRDELLSLAKQVRQLPPNPNAEPLGHNCSSLKLSELEKHKRWDARFHLFYCQYELIAEMLEEWPIEMVLQRLERIIDDGKMIHNNVLTVFHPQVIENLKTLIN